MDCPPICGQVSKVRATAKSRAWHLGILHIGKAAFRNHCNSSVSLRISTRTDTNTRRTMPRARVCVRGPHSRLLAAWALYSASSVRACVLSYAMRAICFSISASSASRLRTPPQEPAPCWGFLPSFLEDGQFKNPGEIHKQTKTKKTKKLALEDALRDGLLCQRRREPG